MSYTLEQFSADCRAALKNDSGADGLEAVRQCVAKACVDSDFIAAHFGPDNNDPRKLLFEDPELKFCIFAHVHEGAKTSPPHDHGPSLGNLWPGRRHHGNDRLALRLAALLRDPGHGREGQDL